MDMQAVQRPWWPMKVHYRNWFADTFLPKRVSAICFGTHVFTREAWLSDHTLAHEFCHVLQYTEFGFIGFLGRWLYWTIRVGYQANPYEVEARNYATQVVVGGLNQEREDGRSSMKKKQPYFKSAGPAPASHPIYQSGTTVGWPIFGQRTTSPGVPSKPTPEKPEGAEEKDNSPQP